MCKSVNPTLSYAYINHTCSGVDPRISATATSLQIELLNAIGTAIATLDGHKSRLRAQDWLALAQARAAASTKSP